MGQAVKVLGPGHAFLAAALTRFIGCGPVEAPWVVKSAASRSAGVIMARTGVPVSGAIIAAAKLRAGSTMGEADLAARQAITAGSYPEFDYGVDYGVGHGVGLAIHESPLLRPNSEEILETDMISTLEPGIYLGEAGGIRIENIYRITPQGNERLGDLPATLGSMVLV